MELDTDDENEFETRWLEFGDDLVMKEWTNLYGDYIVKDTEDEGTAWSSNTNNSMSTDMKNENKDQTWGQSLETTHWQMKSDEDPSSTTQGWGQVSDGSDKLAEIAEERRKDCPIDDKNWASVQSQQNDNEWTKEENDGASQSEDKVSSKNEQGGAAFEDNKTKNKFKDKEMEVMEEKMVDFNLTKSDDSDKIFDVNYENREGIDYVKDDAKTGNATETSTEKAGGEADQSSEFRQPPVPDWSGHMDSSVAAWNACKPVSNKPDDSKWMDTADSNNSQDAWKQIWFSHYETIKNREKANFAQEVFERNSKKSQLNNEMLIARKNRAVALSGDGGRGQEQWYEMKYMSTITETLKRIARGEVNEGGDECAKIVEQQKGKH